jgi:hypothetical protein
MSQDSVKLCECGCGKPAPIASKTRTLVGHVKGRPTRFRVGHNARVPLRWIEQDCGYETLCWVYQGPLGRGGYGQAIQRDTKRLTAHRLAWVLANGTIPHGLWVLHRCDNPPCVNPAHLFLGTCADNHNDQVLKQRQLCGERHPRAVLSEQDVLVIRTSTDETRVLAERYHVTTTHIRRICRGLAWRHMSS